MTLTTADDRITSDVTDHYAVLQTGPYMMPNRWQVSWWPGRLLSPGQAYDAVRFAEITAVPGPDPDADRAALENLASQLQLDVDTAIPMALRAVEDAPALADDTIAAGDLTVSHHVRLDSGAVCRVHEVRLDGDRVRVVMRLADGAVRHRVWLSGYRVTVAVPVAGETS